MPNSTTSKHISYTSAKDLSWGIKDIIQSFIKNNQAQTALRMKNEGLRTSQIARYLYGEADKNTISKVCKLLKEVA